MIRTLVLSSSLVALALPSAAPAREAVTPTAQVTAANRAALREPSNAGYVNAVQVYPYSAGVLYRLYAAPERVTDIALQPGATVTSVAVGHTVRWTVGDTPRGSGEDRQSVV